MEIMPEIYKKKPEDILKKVKEIAHMETEANETSSSVNFYGTIIGEMKECALFVAVGD